MYLPFIYSANMFPFTSFYGKLSPKEFINKHPWILND